MPLTKQKLLSRKEKLQILPHHMSGRVTVNFAVIKGHSAILKGEGRCAFKSDLEVCVIVELINALARVTPEPRLCHFVSDSRHDRGRHGCGSNTKPPTCSACMNPTFDLVNESASLPPCSKCRWLVVITNGIVRTGLSVATASKSSRRVHHRASAHIRRHSRTTGLK